MVAKTSFRTQLIQGKSALEGALADKKAGDIFEIPSTGAKAKVIEGIYKKNKLNDRLKITGQTYLTQRIISNNQKGKKGGIMITEKDGSTHPISRARKTISKTQAQRAFNTYWGRKLREATTDYERRAVLAARARDLNYGRPAYLVNDTRYRQHSRPPGGKKLGIKAKLVGPGPWEYEGVDFGPKRYNIPRPSEKVIADLVTNARNRLAADIKAGRKVARTQEERDRAALGRANAANRRNAGIAAANARRQVL